MSLLFIITTFFLHVYSKTMPKAVVGFYLLIADDGEPGYTTKDNWQPNLYPFLSNGSNVLWTAFINPSMTVPPAMANLAKCRGQAGCPPTDTLVIFSVGGEGYSNTKTWPFLQSSSSATSMAQEVATWSSKYGADGIDLDIETGAGDDTNQANNMLVFVKELKRLAPSFIITQPVYGYPGVKAETLIVNNGWSSSGTPTGLVDSIGIMVYNNEASLNDVKNYANPNGDGVTAKVPSGSILPGIQGGAAGGTITDMASKCVQQKLQGLFVWYSSVYDKTRNKNAFSYDKRSNAYGGSGEAAWAQALAILKRG